jgi:hypothetical protein
MNNDPPNVAPANSLGLTPTERFLYAMCQRSYLQLWSYANPFRDQGKSERGEGKELCDVMAVLGNTVILFSDKSCTFPDTGNESVDWDRWCRRTVDASRKQLSGAERWVRSFPDRIYLDRKCSQPLPISLPDRDPLRVFKICVVTGAADRCRKKYQGGSGSLLLMASMPDDAMRPPPLPFAVDLVDAKGDIYHVIDDVTLPVLLRELDTLPDLIEYLEAKESMIRSKQVGTIAGEEELIGLFLGIRAGIAALEIPPGTRGMIGEGIYRDILTRPEYRKHKEATAPSYFWDSIISYHSASALNGTLVPGSVITIKENEEILRLLAAQPRIWRRFLGGACLDLYRTAARNKINSRTMIGAGDTVYVFRITPSDGNDTPQSRRERQKDLEAYCMLTAWRNRNAKTVVGICASGRGPDRDGFDLFGLEVKEWTEENIALGAKLEQEFAKEVHSPLTTTKVSLPHPFAWKPNDRPYCTNRQIKDSRERRRQQRKDERRRRR